jgi:hypothetical protein
MATAVCRLAAQAIACFASRAFNKDLVMATNAAENPGVFESQVLSLFAEGEIIPGETIKMTR